MDSFSDLNYWRTPLPNLPELRDWSTPNLYPTILDSGNGIKNFLFPNTGTTDDNWFSDAMSSTQTTWSARNLQQLINQSLGSSSSAFNDVSTQTGGDNMTFSQRVMIQQGYQPGTGLGKNSDGIVEPVSSFLGNAGSAAETAEEVIAPVAEVAEGLDSALNPASAFAGIAGNAINSVIGASRSNETAVNFQSLANNAHGLNQIASLKPDFTSASNADSFRTSLGGVLSTFAGPLGAFIAQSIPDSWISNTPDSGIPSQYASQTSDITQQAQDTTSISNGQ